MFVTCFYDIYNNPELVERYLKLFEPLAFSGLPFHLFTSPEIFPRFSHYPPTVKVFAISLNFFKLYKLAMNSRTELPANRNPTKDTKEYLALMNTKAEFLYYASLNTEEKNLIWIDFAILKLIKSTGIDKIVDSLRKINESTFEMIHIPGCWGDNVAMTSDRVLWRFCGTLLISPHSLVKKFYKLSKNVLRDFCYPSYSNLKITWEVNVWYLIEYYNGKDFIQWYQAVHDESMIMNLKVN